MHYFVNVAKNGKHFFATDARSIRGPQELLEVMKDICDRFHEKDGYEVSASYTIEESRDVNVESSIRQGRIVCSRMRMPRSSSTEAAETESSPKKRRSKA